MFANKENDKNLKKGSILYSCSLLLKIKETKQACFTELLSKKIFSVGKCKTCTNQNLLMVSEAHRLSMKCVTQRTVFQYDIWFHGTWNIKMQYSSTLIWKNVIEIWSSISVTVINT